MFKAVKLSEYYHLINHGPCVIVTSGVGDKVNVATVAWNMPVNDDPPILAIALSETHYTTELIKKNKQFVVNIVGKNMLKELVACGSVSGKKTDKIKKNKLKLGQAKKIKTPHLDGALGFIECKLREIKFIEGVALVFGDVIHCSADSKYYDGHWISDKAKTLHHLGGNMFTVPTKRISA